MISEGYEKSLFQIPASDRFLLRDAPEAMQPSGSTRVITKEFDLLRDLREAARVVKLVVMSSEALFKVVESQFQRGVLTIEATRLGSQFLALHRVTQEDVDLYFPWHGYNPYLDLLFRARKARSHEGSAVKEGDGEDRVRVDVASDVEYGPYWGKLKGQDAVLAAEQLNALIKVLRSLAGEREFKNTLDGFRRRCDKNTMSVKSYIDAIFEHRGSRHLVIRLDLGYAMEDAWVAARPTSVTLEQAKEGMARFQRYLRDHLPLTGFVAKLEYGLLRGYHFHVLIFLNGHLVQHDVLIAKMLGEHWRSVICEGKGRYWNCNAEKYKDRGIGRINYDDGDKRVALLQKVAGYLTKTDFWLQFQPGGKTLFKGLMPEPPPKRGRPRARAAE